MFGGRVEGLFGLKYFNDLWSFDAVTQIWTSIKTPNRPSARISPGMVYDPINHQIIVFGGHDPKERLGDTWVYTISDNHWEEITPEISPTSRSDMGMSYDQENKRVILFSGYSFEGSVDRKNDTWSYDPELQIWTEMNPQVSPPIMYGHSLEYDTANQRSLLLGGHILIYRNGQQISGGYNSTIWSYSYHENIWQEEVDDNSPKPPARYWQQSVLNSTDGRILFFGGNGASGFFGDTWVYDVTNTSWKSIHIKQGHGPSPRVTGAIAYDFQEEVFILFGGLGEDMTDFQDTWIFRENDTGGDWTTITSKK